MYIHQIVCLNFIFRIKNFIIIIINNVIVESLGDNFFWGFIMKNWRLMNFLLCSFLFIACLTTFFYKNKHHPYILYKINNHKIIWKSYLYYIQLWIKYLPTKLFRYLLTFQSGVGSAELWKIMKMKHEKKMGRSLLHKYRKQTTKVYKVIV